MHSISDKLLEKVAQKVTQNAAPAMKEVTQAVENTARLGSKTAKSGIAIIIKAVSLTTEIVMAATKAVLFQVEKDVKYSGQNLSISKLQKNGNVTAVDENLTKEAMKYFDQHCRKFKINYSAMKDMRDPNDPQYILFFNGKDDKLILKAIQEAYKSYANDMTVKKKQNDQEQQSDKNKPRESIKAKLEFFRNRAEVLKKVKEKERGNEHKKEREKKDRVH
mgnify:CR=1 FL=1